MKNKRSTIWSVLLIAVIVLVLSACGNKQEGTSGNTASTDTPAAATETPAETEQPAQPDPEKYKGVVVNLEGSQVGPMIIAKEKGWFAEEIGKYGATVEFQTLASASQYNESLAAGRLDIVRTGYIGTITAQAAGISFKSLAEGSSGAPDAILVPEASSIKSILDLKGKTIAVAKGSSSWGLLQHALKKEGISPDEVKLVNLQPGDAQAAYQGGQVDAWVIFEPYRSQQTSTGESRIIAEASTLGIFTPGYVIARTEFAEKYPELVEAFLKAYQKAIDWQKANLDEAVALNAKIKNVSEDTIRASMANPSSVPTNLPVSEEATKFQQQTADFMFELGEIKQKIDVSTVIDNSYLEKTLEDLKAESNK
ncbi:aliphatic sulfonate ABC transporter substrate-binding protein [Paenibacillus luteus]|uniref:aliphatic sulfonate ABC transporter substrate-binding protein n=1 Tax=Paenibacillus luteus TaxID=2545753 RepID=UPI0011412563|nr:aliphatic sulfonate ABC transporter substrate-binding protein [Paenibacillus luteus]